MEHLSYDLIETEPVRMGLVALQTDERIESDFRRMIPQDIALFTSRVPSGLDVSSESLQEMENHIPAAARLLPSAGSLDVVGYGCTSGAAQIGASRVADLVQSGAKTEHVTEPVSALIAACRVLRLHRLAFLSPYVEEVSGNLRYVLSDQGIATPFFGSFAEAEEAKVARITQASVSRAAKLLAEQGDVDGLFLSCTNLDTLDVIAPLQAAVNMPVLSSNLVLGWHMCQLAGSAPVEIPATAGLIRAY